MARGAAKHGRTYGKPSSLPPTFHNLQADLSAQQTGIGRVVPESARSQVELVDEGGALVESVVDPEIELCMGEPARAAVHPVADIHVDRRPRIHSSLGDRGGIAVSSRVVQGALHGPAL